MQLHLRLFWSLAEPHEDAQWGKAFQVQQMQQSFWTKERAHKTFHYSHDLDSYCKSYFEIHKPWKLVTPSVYYVLRMPKGA